MEKLLTISVAAYQVADYIRQNLNSLILSDIINELEIFVIDDGGKDDTLAIARQYEKKYPESVHAIHKENGGYGSTVNYSIQHATGKYFKLLDGDDWFDINGLQHLIDILRTVDADVVATPFLTGADEDDMKLMQREWKSLYGKLVPIESVGNAQIPMWCITYKTECLKKADLRLPEHTLYTDNIYTIIPFQFVQEILFDSVPVYCYRTGRDGQSMSVESRIKHVQEAIDVSIEVCNFFKSEIKPSDKCREFILYRCAGACRFALTGLLLLPANAQNRKKIIQYDQEVKRISPEIYDAVTKVGKFGKVLRLLRFSGYRGVKILRNHIPN